MAESSSILINKGSDVEHNTCCYVCEENGSRTDAKFYCEQCSKYYCDNCNGQHSQTFKKHVTVIREVRTWFSERVKSTVEPIFQCMDHIEEKIELFCEDHDQLLCLVCDLKSHRKCSVTRIADKIKDDKIKGQETIPDFQQMLCSIKSHQEQLQERKKDRNKDIQFLNASCDKQFEDIELYRKEIDASLDVLETRVKNKLMEEKASLNTEFETYIKQCSSISEKLQRLSDIIQNLGESAADLYITYIKYIELTRTTVSLNGRKTRQGNVKFIPQTIIKHYVSSMLQLGYITSEKVTNSNEILKVQGKKYHEVYFKVDKQSCCITGICELPSGVFVIIDSANKSVKLLDTNYKVVTHLLLSSSSESLCQVDTREVAVAIKTDNVDKIYFLRVEENKLVKTKSFYLNHSCRSVAHCLGSMLVSTGQELYMYALDGRQVKKIYEDTSMSDPDIHRVGSCAASIDGSKIYFFNNFTDSLLTLSPDGDILASLTDKNSKRFSKSKNSNSRVSVALTGHVFVSCADKQHIVQVHTDGTQILALFPFHCQWGMVSPPSVCYSERESAILVGTNDEEQILVLKN